MNEREYERERLRQLRLERFGSDSPTCIICDEDDPCCLELHHVGGKVFGDEQTVVCRNHHRKLGDRQKEHPRILPGPPTRNECEGRKLLGIADIEELLGTPAQIINLIRQIGLGLVERAQSLRDRAGDAS